MYDWIWTDDKCILDKYLFLLLLVTQQVERAELANWLKVTATKSRTFHHNPWQTNSEG